MRVLAIDTLMNACSVACFDSESGTSHSLSKEMVRGQAEVLVPMIENVLVEAGWSYKNIDMIGVTIGPGAFTGLRIGLSTAKALGLSLDKPVCGVSNFDVMLAIYKSQNISDNKRIGITLETKRDDYYVATYSPEDGIYVIGVKSNAEISVLFKKDGVSCVIGDAVERFQTALDDNEVDEFEFHNIKTTNPEIIAELCFVKHSHGKTETAIQPLYLRGADISFSKKEARKLKVL